MLTVNVEHSKVKRTVYSCRRYTVDVQADGSVHMRLFENGELPPHDVKLENGEVAYVMNGEGKTVDVVRKRHAS